MNERLKFRYVFKDEDDEIIIEYHDLGGVERGLVKWIHDKLQSWTLVTRDQCTGLRDKNKKLIFEGDIMKCIDIEDSSICSIAFARSAFRVKFDDVICSEIDDMHLKWFEVIGNIHENGDLLN